MKRVKSFSGDIIYQRDVILTRLIMYRYCKIIVNIYPTCNMMILIMNIDCTFPMKDNQVHL